MKKHLIELSAIIGLTGLFIAGMGTTAVRADDDYRYIPNDHRPLQFKNYDGTLRFKSHRRSRRVRRTVSKPIHQRSLEAPITAPSSDRRNVVEPSAKTAALICPVTGDKIASIKDAVGQSTYNDKTYYFCCAGCKPRFDKDPAKFIKNAAAGKYEKM